MRLPPRFVLTIEGTLWRIRKQRDEAGFDYLLKRLMAGEEVADTVWRPFGLRVTVEIDSDGGDEEVDELLDRPLLRYTPPL